jgi:hypothetical protein
MYICDMEKLTIEQVKDIVLKQAINHPLHYFSGDSMAQYRDQVEVKEVYKALSELHSEQLITEFRENKTPMLTSEGVIAAQMGYELYKEHLIKEAIEEHDNSTSEKQKRKLELETLRYSYKWRKLNLGISIASLLIALAALIVAMCKD